MILRSGFFSWRPDLPLIGAKFGGVSDGAPIELLGLDAEREVILARRAGEPSFVWVQDLADAHQAAALRGGT